MLSDDANDEHLYLKLKNLKQKSIKFVEVYYERWLKLANCLQMPTTDNFLTTIFQFGLQSYLRIATMRLYNSTRSWGWFTKKVLLCLKHKVHSLYHKPQG